MIVMGYNMEVMKDLMEDGGDEVGDGDPCGLAAVCNQEVCLLSSQILICAMTFVMLTLRQIANS